MQRPSPTPCDPHHTIEIFTDPTADAATLDTILMRLDTHHTLPGGPRLRLRLPQVRDGVQVRELLHRLGLRAGELDLVRLLRFDPTTRTIVCATVWTGTEETLVGLAATSHGNVEPDVVITDEVLAPGTAAALRQTLGDVAARARAAA